MSKHTPGPWRIKYSAYNNRPASIETSSYSVASFNAVIWDKNWNEAAANARLIAAAPEILQALYNARDALGAIMDHFEHDLAMWADVKDDFDRCCLAINKAEGK